MHNEFKDLKPISISLWVYPIQAPKIDRGSVLFKGQSGKGNKLIIFVTKGLHLCVTFPCVVIRKDDSGQTTLQSTATVSLNAWVHVVVSISKCNVPYF